MLAAQGSALPQADSAAAQARVLVLGIADIVLVFDDHSELLDYKTDRKKTEQELSLIHISEKIEQLVAAGEPVREGSATRPVRYEDC